MEYFHLKLFEMAYKLNILENRTFAKGVKHSSFACCFGGTDV
jgi:hypothetical protein